jgi:ubiquinone/menaquinone biosynthesis C-methylase UbiE
MTENQAWKRSETILHYQRTADITIPGRKEMLATIAELASSQNPQRLRVLDLGCGTGDIAGEILGLRSEAEFCMLDFSDGMLELARERFRGNEHVRILQHDLNEGIPENLSAEKFDVVTSCFALHHIELERRVGLYADIYRVLDDDGLFINGDIILRESPAVREWELNRLMTWIVGQAKSKLGLERTFEQLK